MTDPSRTGPCKIVPSVTTADFSRLGEEVAALAAAGVDRFHWDAMDGVFVPNLTFGPAVIASCRPLVRTGFEVHIMCDRPEAMLPRYVDAGCELLIVHPETLRQPHAAYQQIRDLGARVGVAVSPATPLTVLDHVMDLVDLVLVMTVNPGFGGQAFLTSMMGKVGEARARIDACDHPIELEVDGGVGPDTIAAAARGGADVFVTGSALWKYDTFDAAVTDLRGRAEAAAP